MAGTIVLFRFIVFAMMFVACLSAWCNEDLRDELERKCESSYDVVSESADDLEDAQEREEVLCCGLEDLEDCSYKAYDIAHCKDQKPALRENLKAARLFLSVISNVTCSAYKAKCSSAAVNWNAASMVSIMYFVMQLHYAVYKMNIL